MNDEERKQRVGLVQVLILITAILAGFWSSRNIGNLYLFALFLVSILIYYTALIYKAELQSKFSNLGFNFMAFMSAVSFSAALGILIGIASFRFGILAAILYYIVLTFTLTILLANPQSVRNIYNRIGRIIKFLIFWRLDDVDKSITRENHNPSFRNYAKLFSKLVFSLLFLFLLLFGIYLFWNPENFVFELVIGIITVLVSVLLIEELLQLPEKLRWENVKSLVITNILRRELKGIFTDLRNLVDPVVGRGIGNGERPEEVWYEQLKNKLMEISEKAEIGSFGRKMLSGIGTLFIYRANRLDNIETKYFRFLDSNLVTSLIKIEDNLRTMDMHTGIFLKHKRQDAIFRWFKTDEEYYKIMAGIIKSIFKELRNIYEKENIDFLKD